MEYPDIITADESNFEFQVLEYSQRVPVLVNFWAPWSSTCKKINPLLEDLAREQAGRFRLALVDVDSNPTLTQRYQVHTVPSLKVFENGAVTRKLDGIKTDLQVIQYVKAIVPGPENLLLEKGLSQLESGQYQDVEETSLEILELVPDHPLAKLLLAKSLIWQGEYLEALTILNHFPASPDFNRAERLRPLAEQLLAATDQQTGSPDQLDPIFIRAINLIKNGNIPAALDGLLGVLQKDKKYKDGLPRLVILGLFELLGDDHPLTIEYRDLLANTLF